MFALNTLCFASRVAQMWHKEGVEFWVAGHHRFEESIMLKRQTVTNSQGLDEMIPVRAGKKDGNGKAIKFKRCHGKYVDFSDLSKRELREAHREKRLKPP